MEHEFLDSVMNHQEDILSTPVSKPNPDSRSARKCSPSAKKTGRLSFGDDDPCDECAICLESLESDTVETRCKHKFHASCLLQVKIKTSFECPLCKSRLTPPKNSDIPIQEDDNSRRQQIITNSQRVRMIMHDRARRNATT